MRQESAAEDQHALFPQRSECLPQLEEPLGVRELGFIGRSQPFLAASFSLIRTSSLMRSSGMPG